MILRENIVLSGFMGSGKSTVGAALAKRLSVPFVDSDVFLEQREGMTIAELFRRFSEQGFRDREHKALVALSQRQGIVIATGGGALLFSRNVLPLRSSGRILFINTPFADCYTRIADSKRPLVQSNSREQLQELYELRTHAYRESCDCELPGTGTPRELVGAAIKLMGLK